jgi:hypothetical protein
MKQHRKLKMLSDTESVILFSGSEDFLSPAAELNGIMLRLEGS